jgi:predicted ArsR family transcriptional regulator
MTFREDERVDEELERQVAGIGALVEPARRALYLFVAAQPGAVSREQAAEGVGVALHSVKFHLDRLVEEGLLDVEFRRLTGRSGPGAGRPSKLYRRSDRQLTLSLPARRYDLAGEVLAEAVDRSVREDVPVGDAVRDAAATRGRRIGADAITSAGSCGLNRTAEVLRRQGYEPRVLGEEIVLANCPFDRLARDHTDLVCGLNLALISGVLQGMGCRTLEVALDPRPGLCCVRTRLRG